MFFNLLINYFYYLPIVDFGFDRKNIILLIQAYCFLNWFDSLLLSISL